MRLIDFIREGMPQDAHCMHVMVPRGAIWGRKEQGSRAASVKLEGGWAERPAGGLVLVKMGCSLLHAKKTVWFARGRWAGPERQGNMGPGNKWTLGGGGRLSLSVASHSSIDCSSIRPDGDPRGLVFSKSLNRCPL